MICLRQAAVSYKEMYWRFWSISKLTRIIKFKLTYPGLSLRAGSWPKRPDSYLFPAVYFCLILSLLLTKKLILIKNVEITCDASFSQFWVEVNAYFNSFRRADRSHQDPTFEVKVRRFRGRLGHFHWMVLNLPKQHGVSAEEAEADIAQQIFLGGNNSWKTLKMAFPSF